MKKGRNSGSKTENASGEDGAELWRHVTRSVRAYQPSVYSPAQSMADRVHKAALPPSRKTSASSPAGVPPETASARGFDRSTETRLKKGQLPLEGKLDLHDMTQREAHEALQRFMQAAIAGKKRTVLIITGKGRLSGGVLRRMLPLWLEGPDLSPYILAVTPAHRKDGGEGAFYVRLRKPKPV